MSGISGTENSIQTHVSYPGLKEPPLSVYDDWMEFEITLYQIRGKTDLHEISCFAEKDGNRYCICTVLDNEDSITTSLRDFGFGRQIPVGGPAAEDYLSPKYLEEDGKTWLIRCITIGLENGNRALAWLKYDLTEDVREHGYFLLRCVLLTIVVTLLASVITALIMRRYVLNPVRSLAQATREFVPEEDGTVIDTDVIYDKIEKAIISLDDSIDLRKEGCYVEAKIKSDNKKLVKLAEKAGNKAAAEQLVKQAPASRSPGRFRPSKTSAMAFPVTS